LTDNGRCPAPEQFTFDVDCNNPNPTSFSGSDRGTLVSLEPEAYEVTEIAPDLPVEVVLTSDFSPDCTGDIEAGQELTCTVLNYLDSE
jgi:hypothetical protein